MLDFILDGLRESGCRIIYASDPREAPFIVSFETGVGERLGVVAYAFTATRTPTKRRPPDERSFQIKYGNKEGYEVNSHELWQDRLGLFTTLLVGVDPRGGFLRRGGPGDAQPDEVLYSPRVQG